MTLPPTTCARKTCVASHPCLDHSTLTLARLYRAATKQKREVSAVCPQENSNFNLPQRQHRRSIRCRFDKNHSSLARPSRIWLTKNTRVGCAQDLLVDYRLASELCMSTARPFPSPSFSKCLDYAAREFGTARQTFSLRSRYVPFTHISSNSLPYLWTWHDDDAPTRPCGHTCINTHAEIASENWIKTLPTLSYVIIQSRAGSKRDVF
ncbi:hypothetical protein B0H10DRAFT_894109 [Mycena sp. CBHHK59/15]|nr:hypothetical protein B0H10DRAFT_894109 [Mycena sp. CBHHK59/15]